MKSWLRRRCENGGGGGIKSGTSNRERVWQRDVKRCCLKENFDLEFWVVGALYYSSPSNLAMKTSKNLFLMIRSLLELSFLCFLIEWKYLLNNISNILPITLTCHPCPSRTPPPWLFCEKRTNANQIRANAPQQEQQQQKLTCWEFELLNFFKRYWMTFLLMLSSF